MSPRIINLGISFALYFRRNGLKHFFQTSIKKLNLKQNFIDIKFDQVEVEEPVFCDISKILEYLLIAISL